MSQSSMPLSFRVVPFKDEILDVWIDRLCSKFDVNRQWLFRHIGLPSELNSRDLSRGIYYGGRLDTIMTNDLINRLATFSGVDAIELARTIIKFDKMYLLPKIHMVYVCPICWRDSYVKNEPRLLNRQWMTSVSWFCSEHLLPLVNKFHFGINYRSLDVCAFDNAISHSESILNQLGGTIPNTGSIVDALNLLINGIPINKLARSYFQSLTGNIFHLTNFRIEFIGCVAMTNLGVENCEIDEDLFNKFEQFQILVARFSDSINDYIGTNRKINYAIPPIRPKQIVAYDTTLRDLSSEYFTSIKRYYSQQPDLDWNGAAEFAHRSPTARLAKAARRLETGFQYARFHAAGNAYGRSPQAVCDAIEVSIESIECLPIGRVQRCSTLHREFGLRADLQEVRAASAGDEFNFLARVLQAHMVRRLRARQALAKQQTKYVPAIFLGQNFSNAKLHDHP